MGYQVWKEGNTWRLVFQKGTKLKKHRIKKHSREAAELGFRPEFTLKEALARAEQLRNEKWAEDHAEKAAKTRAIQEKYQKLRGAFLTGEDANEFERIYLPEKRIARAHWHTIQSIIVNMGIHPSQWYKQSSVIFQEKLYERGVTREKCWKFIPTVLPGQKQAIEMIKARNFKRPVGKQGKLFKYIFGPNYTVIYLVSWNCTHIASGRVRRVIREINDEHNLETPTICTPRELMEV